ncbi:MAG: 2Fe-2S iron-sulfur cluster-binding protein [Mycobacteriales bacterium]
MELRVARRDAEGASASRIDQFEVPEFEGMTVLDALIWAREHVDPSLGIRYSCRSANACKECLALVNGVATYTCTVRALGTVLVEPLPHKPLIRDIIVEL